MRPIIGLLVGIAVFVGLSATWIVVAHAIQWRLFDNEIASPPEFGLFLLILWGAIRSGYIVKHWRWRFPEDEIKGNRHFLSCLAVFVAVAGIVDLAFLGAKINSENGLWPIVGWGLPILAAWAWWKWRSAIDTINEILAEKYRRQ
ncbi:MAG: hypothetical protein AB7L65_03495 [Hyphomonadaceae bacterium]